MQLEHTAMSAYNLILDVMAQSRVATRMPAATRGPLLLSLLAVGWIGGCSEPATARPERIIQGPALAADVVDGSALRCAPRPTVVAVSVEPGTDADANGNGIVCEERVGPVGVPGVESALPLVMDDAIVPTADE